MHFKDLLSGHPKLFEKLKDYCLITDRDMEHVAHESIPVRLYFLIFRAKKMKRKCQ